MSRLDYRHAHSRSKFITLSPAYKSLRNSAFPILTRPQESPRRWHVYSVRNKFRFGQFVQVFCLNGVKKKNNCHSYYIDSRIAVVRNGMADDISGHVPSKSLIPLGTLSFELPDTMFYNWKKQVFLFPVYMLEINMDHIISSGNEIRTSFLKKLPTRRNSTLVKVLDRQQAYPSFSYLF